MSCHVSYVLIPLPSSFPDSHADCCPCDSCGCSNSTPAPASGDLYMSRLCAYSYDAVTMDDLTIHADPEDMDTNADVIRLRKNKDEMGDEDEKKSSPVQNKPKAKAGCCSGNGNARSKNEQVSWGSHSCVSCCAWYGCHCAGA